MDQLGLINGQRAILRTTPEGCPNLFHIIPPGAKVITLRPGKFWGYRVGYHWFKPISKFEWQEITSQHRVAVCIRQF